MKPATFREVRKYTQASIEPELIAQACSALGMKCTESSDGLMKFTVRLNFWSWGERVTVVLGAVEECSLVDITSACLMPSQFVDWGKNEQNVRQLFAEIDRLLGSESAHEECLLCARCGYLLAGIPAVACPECGCPISAGDQPGLQDVATAKTALMFAAVITAIEVLLILGLDWANAGAFVPWPVQGLFGAVHLLCVNVIVLLALVGLHRWVKRRRRRG